MQVQSKRVQVLAKQATCQVHSHCSIAKVGGMDGIRQNVSLSLRFILLDTTSVFATS